MTQRRSGRLADALLTILKRPGRLEGKEGAVKHLYLGILFIYNESESDNFGFFCAQCGSCENIKKQKEMRNPTAENSEDHPISMFSQLSYEQNEQRGTERLYRSTREQLFSIGQMLRIRKGPLKGYLCRVVRIFRNDVTVKLDSLLKIVTVQAEFLSVPSNRGVITSGAPIGNLGSQDSSLFEADKTSWDNRLPSFGSDGWQPFSSSTLPVQNKGEDNDPWRSKVTSTEDKEQQNDTWERKMTTAGPEDNGGSWNSNVKDSSHSDVGEERQNDPWANKTGSNKDKEQEADPWASKVSSTTGADYNNDTWNTKAKVTPLDCVGNWGSAACVSSGAEEKPDVWGSKGSDDNSKKSDGWDYGSSGASWDKPSFSLGDQEPAWGKSRFSDDNNGNSRGGFGRGNRGRGRGQFWG